MLKKMCSVAIALSLAFSLTAAVKDLPVRTIKGKEYYCYKVEPGEGTLAISKKLGLSIKDLEKYNPEITRGLQLGQELKFPVADFKDSVSGNTGKKKSSKTVVNYVAKKGDTVYGISKNFNMELYDFLELNPDAIEGVKIGHTYKVIGENTAETPEVKTTPAAKQAKEPVVIGTHVIGTGETLYSIAHKYDCSIEDLIMLNPGLDKGHYEIGQTINVPQKKNNVSDHVTSSFRGGKTHTVKEHDTFYGIARQYGVTIDQLQSANPGVNLLHDGMTLLIPDSCDETAPAAIAEPAEETITVAETFPGGMETQPIKVLPPRSRASIAIILPFMNSLKEKNKEAKASADFYRGFMLAIDSLKAQGIPMTVMAFDTDQSPEKLTEILADSRLKDVQAIVAPEGASELQRVAQFGADNHINVFNVFSTKDTSFLSNRYLFQGNIPYDDMVDKASDYFARNIGNATAVVLRPKVNVDKIEVVEKLTKKLKANGVETIEITFADKLTSEDLDRLSKDKDYVFIPTTAKANPSTEILAAIAKYKEDNTGIGRVAVFGYPEWTVFKGKPLENMKNTNTTIYSRFFMDGSDFGSHAVEDSHLRWYGFEMPAGVPRMTLTGFDTAMFLVNSIQANQGDFTTYSPNYDGEQNPYHFVKSGPEGGWFNDCMYIINYHPSGLVEKIPL